MGWNAKTERAESSAGAVAARTDLKVHGMTCSNCVRHVHNALEELPGVDRASVDLESGAARVQWQAGQRPDSEAVFRAVREAGYEPQLPANARVELAVEGMTCSNCARSVVTALQNVPGVRSVDVQLEAGEAWVSWQSNDTPDSDALLQAVSDAGYTARVLSPQRSAPAYAVWSPFSGWQFNVVVGTALTLPLLILEWVFGFGLERWYHWFAFALVLPVQFLCGLRFYRGAWNQLKVGQSNMDTLVVLGSTTAFSYSAWALFSGWTGHLFFMESASIITLISVGHWVESRVSARAAHSLRALLELAPPQARLLDPGGAERLVPVAQLRIDDTVVVKPGDRVPVDSVVAEGTSVVDESMLTGEAIPVSKSKGACVYAGTSNLHGWLLTKVAATGEETALAQIIAVVQRAQSSRANIQKLGDRVSSVFVPIVVLIALITGLAWGLAPAQAGFISGWFEPILGRAHHPVGPWAAAIYHAAAVLIIACPCAMGLATPVAIMAGANAAAQRGILIRDGVALEKSGVITCVLFDKTGTLTSGRIGLELAEDFLTPAEQEQLGFHKIVASLAKSSMHPLSLALAGLSNVYLPLEDWQELRGSGVQARLKGESILSGSWVRVGSPAWLESLGVDLTPAHALVTEWSARGATVIGVAANQRLLGVLALRDRVKEHAPNVVAGLLRQGKSVYLISGDSPATAAAVAQQVGIAPDHVFAQVRPEDKAHFVQQLQQQGEKVAFVGDGINDAPALEQADLGVAVARASDVAREAADIILLNSDIQAVPEALQLAQATLRTIKQNLFWAFFYNALGIPLAALGYLSPVFSAFAMGASDLVVIGNALRLRAWKFKIK